MEPEVTPEVTPEQVPPVVEPTPEPTPEPITEDKEPGGNTPEEIWARKEWRAAKEAREEATRQREENIRLQERLRTIEEERQRTPAPAERVYTRAELNAQVEAGNLERKDADRYIDEVLTPYQTRKALEAYEAARAERVRVDQAKQEIGEYLKFIPDLNDRASPEFRKVAIEYQDLLNDGLPDNDLTRRRAVKNVYGNLETVRKKHELAELNAQPRTIPSDAGGGGGVRSNGKVDISKAPATMVASWEREGADQVTRERRYRIYLDLKARQNAR